MYTAFILISERSHIGLLLIASHTFFFKRGYAILWKLYIQCVCLQNSYSINYFKWFTIKFSTTYKKVATMEILYNILVKVLFVLSWHSKMNIFIKDKTMTTDRNPEIQNNSITMKEEFTYYERCDIDLWLEGHIHDLKPSLKSMQIKYHCAIWPLCIKNETGIPVTIRKTDFIHFWPWHLSPRF